MFDFFFLTAAQRDLFLIPGSNVSLESSLGLKNAHSCKIQYEAGLSRESRGHIF